jgi:hypothetical protein
MGILVADQIDLNDVNVVNKLRLAIQNLINNPSRYYPLRFKSLYYFEIPNASLPPTKGWYIILDGTVPIYAGKANDLNARLNTNNGSIDNFANKTRASDSKRNFIKKFDELNIFRELRVCIIQERELFSEFASNPTELTDLDRTNIEKIIDIFKCYFSYK